MNINSAQIASTDFDGVSSTNRDAHYDMISYACSTQENLRVENDHAVLCHGNVHS